MPNRIALVGISINPYFSEKPISMLIILHGALGSASQMKPFGQLLKEKGLENICLDLPGHGRGTDIDAFDMTQFANYILQQMDEMDIQKVDFFGYSMGGYVALQLAFLYPERVGRIFTFSTKFNWTPEGAAHETKLLNPSKIKEKVPAFAATLAERHGEDCWEQVLVKTAEMMINLGNSPLLTESKLKQIQHQVLLATGDRDNTATAEETLQTSRFLPNAKLWISPNTSHPFEKLPITEIVTACGKFFQKE
ncbi:alpha/beta fold hydrolase [Fulvivirgaceae bacterium LMO-SS25]